MLVSIFNPPSTEFRSFSMQKEFCLVIEVSIIDDPEDRYSRTMTSLKNAIIPSFLTGNFDKLNSFFFQPEYMSPEERAERLKDAMPCHNYKAISN